MPDKPKSLRPEGYLPRIMDAQLHECLEAFGGVELRGARWSGKSWTALAFGASLTRVDTAADLYAADPDLALAGASPHVIDEWQDAPAIWNAVRHRIDDTANRPGQFILTGSSSPLDRNGEQTRHSGAGRIARLVMRTMTLFELGISSGAVSLNGLFQGRFEPVASSLGLAELAEIVCRGGWPALARGQTNPSRVVASYLDALFEDSMVKAGKNPLLARRIAQSLARNLATPASLSTLAQDAASGEQAPAPETVSAYLDELQRNHFIEELPGWDAPIRARARLRTKPKRYLADPSLAAALLGVGPERLIEDGQLLGLMLESQAVHDLAVYAQRLPGYTSASLRYYGDSTGLESDLIIERADGSWAAFEIKLGESKVEEGAAQLARLRAKITANPAARNPEPAFLAVLLGRGIVARRRKEDGVYVVPIGCLGP